MSELPWAIRSIRDRDGEDTGFAFLRGPLDAFEGQDLFDALCQDHLMVGLTSMGPYPAYHEGYGKPPPDFTPSDGWRRPFVTACKGWAHCFREPELYLPPDVPWELISEADFTDGERTWRLATEGGRPAKRWDVVYSCLGNRFNEMQKNWDLARRCLEQLAGLPGLRILLVGRTGTADLPDLPGVETCGYIPWAEFLQCLVRSRLAFFPNVLDASPRVMTEALTLDVPIVVNERILGGWKYVNPRTGAFFRDESDVVAAITTVLAGAYDPRAWFTDNHGPEHSGARLAEFLAVVAAAAGSPEPAATWARFSGRGFG
jgi:hypothetical protein